MASRASTRYLTQLRSIARPAATSPSPWPLPTFLITRLTGLTSTNANTNTSPSFAPLSSHTYIPARYSSHSPMGTPPANPRKKVTLQTLRNLYKKGEPISVLTAHDFPSAHVAETTGIDIVLVGDSLAMVALGMEDTSEVVMEEMILHCRSVARAAGSAFTVSIPLFSWVLGWAVLTRCG